MRLFCLASSPAQQKSPFWPPWKAKLLKISFNGTRFRRVDTFFIPAKKFRTRLAQAWSSSKCSNIQDLTYRVYDYGRTNSAQAARIHLEKALASQLQRRHCRKSFRASLCPRSAAHVRLLRVPLFGDGTRRVAGLCDCSTNKGALRTSRRIERQWTNSVDRRRSQLRSGQCWFIPANLDVFVIQPLHESSIIRTYVPDLAASKSAGKRRCFARCAFPHSFRLKLFLRALGLSRPSFALRPLCPLC